MSTPRNTNTNNAPRTPQELGLVWNPKRAMYSGMLPSTVVPSGARAHADYQGSMWDTWTLPNGARVSRLQADGSAVATSN